MCFPFTSSGRAPQSLTQTRNDRHPNDLSAPWILPFHWPPQALHRRNFLTWQLHLFSSPKNPTWSHLHIGSVHLSAKRPSLDQLFYVSLASPAQHAHMPTVSIRFSLAGGILSPSCFFLVPHLFPKPALNLHLLEGRSPLRSHSVVTWYFFLTGHYSTLTGIIGRHGFYCCMPSLHSTIHCTQ